MTPLHKIKSGQRWAFAKIKRGDIEVSHINMDSKTIYWRYVDYESNVFDSPYEKFIQDFIPREEEKVDLTPPKPGPNDDRNFLT